MDKTTRVTPSAPGQSACIEMSKYFGSGISISFVRSRNEFGFSGWFDSFVGIDGDIISLGELCTVFKITPQMVEKALAEYEADGIE